MNTEMESAELQVVLEATSVNASVPDTTINVTVGDGAKIEVGEAITYIKSGQAEIKEAVTEVEAEITAHAEEKTAEFDANALNKTNAFNQNATDKTTAFNNNATSKTADFNTNASNKTSDFNTNATNKTTAFNENYTEKKGLIDAQVGVAEDYADLAKDWATKTDGKVDGVDYSSKYWAQQILPIASDITTVAGIASDVTTVSSISSDVTSVASNSTDISTVADSISDVNSVATDILKVTAVADDLTNIDAVNANKTNIDAVAGNNSNITAVANNATNINAVAGNESNINAVNANKTNIDTVASISPDVTTVSGISSDVTSVASNNTDISAVADDLTNINSVADDLTNIDSVAGDLSNIDAVNSNKTNIDAVAGNNANITAVADNETNINAVAGNATNINAVNANKANIDAVAGINADVTTVAGIASDVTAVKNNATNINTVAGDSSAINTVAGISTEVSTVAGIDTDITTVSGISSDVTSVASNSTDISAVASDLTNIGNVASDLTNIDSVAGNIANVNAVASNATNINAVNSNKTNIDAVAGNASNINTVAGISSDVSTVAGISSDVTAVKNNATDISTVATNISDVSSVATDISNVNAVADDLANINAVNSNKTNIDAVAGDLTNINAVAGDLTNINNASTYADNANIWAEGSDAQVQALGGVHSSKGWAEQSAQGQVQSNWAETDTTAKSYIQNKPTLGTMASESASDYTKTSGLATVATSGSYADLSNKPTIPTVNNATLTIQKNSTDVATFSANASSNVTANISVPTKVSDLSNDSGFITGITSGDVTTALGYTPVNPTSLATVATSGSYNDLTNKPTIPTVTDTYSATSSDGMSGKAVASAISGKANDSDVVKLSGNQTIAGSKTLTGQTYFANGENLYWTQITKGTNPSSTSYKNIFTINDSSYNSGGTWPSMRLAVGELSVDTTGKADFYFGPYKYEANSSANAFIHCVYDKANNKAYATCPAPTEDTTSSKQIDTVGTRNTKLANYQPLLTSGTNIKTINGNSVLGSGDLTVGGSSRNIGEIVSSTIPLTDAGLHLLDGALINGSGSYADFVTYIAGLVSTYPDLFTTEANWQQAVTSYGVCGKFVYDSLNNTVRLPKYSNKFWSGGGTASVFGDGKVLGVTVDGTNNYGLYMTPDYRMSRAVAGLYNQNIGTTPSGREMATNKGFGVVTSGESGLIADLSTITTALDGYWYIVIATSTKTQIEVDIDEVMTDLNGKADVDLSNCTKPHIVETYISGTSWYRVYSDGWCEQGGRIIPHSGSVWRTCTLLKAFSNTDYIVIVSARQLNQNAEANYGVLYTGTYTTTGFNYKGWYNDNINTAIEWQACGYIN